MTKKVKIPLLVVSTLLLLFVHYHLLIAEEKNYPPKCVINKSDHIVRVNKDGYAIRLEGKSEIHLKNSVGKDSFEEYVKNMLDKAECLADCRKSLHGNGKTTAKILIHFHGGLSPYSVTDQRVEKFAEKIMSDKGNDWHYPIFFSWLSSVGSTYGEQLVSIRQGEKKDIMRGALGVPFVFLSQTGKSIGKIPENSFYWASNTKDMIGDRFNSRFLKSYLWREADKNIDEYVGNRNRVVYHIRTSGKQKVRSSRFFNTKRDYFLRYPFMAITFPIRISIGNLVHSTFGTDSWKNMKRRTSNIYYPVHLFHSHDESAFKYAAGGDFFKYLFNRIERNTSKYQYEVTLIGHSMGAFLINKLLLEYQRKFRKTNILKNIVYMAAACTINEAKNALTPLLEKIPAGINNNEIPKFYNLTLNRVAEISEPVGIGYVGYLAPSGSLLRYIDNHYEKPEMMLDRTMGSEANILTSIKVFNSETDSSTHFKSFDRLPGYIPSKHEDFNNCPFWRQKFWYVETEKGTSHSGESINCYLENWLEIESLLELILQMFRLPVDDIEKTIGEKTVLHRNIDNLPVVDYLPQVVMYLLNKREVGSLTKREIATKLKTDVKAVKRGIKFIKKQRRVNRDLNSKIRKIEIMY